jgi:hypothetical protein
LILGYFQKDVLDSPLLQPFLWINSDLFQWKENLDQMKTTCENTKTIAYQITIKETSHHNFNDLPILLAPFLIKLIRKKTKSFLGNIDSTLAFKIINYFMIKFFEHHLIENNTKPMEIHTFPEITYEIFMPNKY